MSTTHAAQVGAIAPDFKLQNQDEEWITLSERTRDRPVMIAFYPGDFTPVCTQQLCGYQEAFDRFVKYGIEVLGVSPNSPEEHQKFRHQYRFAFDLLSDTDKSVFKRFGVTSLFMFGGISRAVFVIGKGGKIAYRHVEPTTLTHRKSDEILTALDALKAQGRI